jgi:hypothetical protein
MTSRQSANVCECAGPALSSPPLPHHTHDMFSGAIPQPCVCSQLRMVEDTPTGSQMRSPILSKWTAWDTDLVGLPKEAP